MFARKSTKKITCSIAILKSTTTATLLHQHLQRHLRHGYKEARKRKSSATDSKKVKCERHLLDVLQVANGEFIEHCLQQRAA